MVDFGKKLQEAVDRRSALERLGPPPAGIARAAELRTWTKEDTQAYLDANPLPREFKWPHRDHRNEESGGLRPVQPSHTSVTSYGKWLRETPYFPGLFELVHEILNTAPDLGDADWLAAELTARRNKPARTDGEPLF